MSQENERKSEEKTNGLGERERGEEWDSYSTSSFGSSDCSE